MPPMTRGLSNIACEQPKFGQLWACMSGVSVSGSGGVEVVWRPPSPGRGGCTMSAGGIRCAASRLPPRRRETPRPPLRAPSMEAGASFELQLQSSAQRRGVAYSDWAPVAMFAAAAVGAPRRFRGVVERSAVAEAAHLGSGQEGLALGSRLCPRGSTSVGSTLGSTFGSTLGRARPTLAGRC